MKRTLPLLLILAIMLVTGCSKPQSVFEQYVAVVQKGDFDATTALRVEKPEGGIGPSFTAEQDEELEKVWFSKVKVENVETKTSGAEATVTFKITAPDLSVLTKQTMGDMMGVVFASAISNAFENDKSKSDKDMKQFKEMAISKMISSLQKPDVLTATRNGTATLINTDGKWKIAKLNVNWGWNN